MRSRAVCVQLGCSGSTTAKATVDQLQGLVDGAHGDFGQVSDLDRAVAADLQDALLGLCYGRFLQEKIDDVVVVDFEYRHLRRNSIQTKIISFSNLRRLGTRRRPWSSASLQRASPPFEGSCHGCCRVWMLLVCLPRSRCLGSHSSQVMAWQWLSARLF